MMEEGNTSEVCIGTFFWLRAGFHRESHGKDHLWEMHMHVCGVRTLAWERAFPSSKLQGKQCLSCCALSQHALLPPPHLTSFYSRKSKIETPNYGPYCKETLITEKLCYTLYISFPRYWRLIKKTGAQEIHKPFHSVLILWLAKTTELYDCI